MNKTLVAILVAGLATATASHAKESESEHGQEKATTAAPHSEQDNHDDHREENHKEHDAHKIAKSFWQHEEVTPDPTRPHACQWLAHARALNNAGCLFWALYAGFQPHAEERVPARPERVHSHHPQ